MAKFLKIIVTDAKYLVIRRKALQFYNRFGIFAPFRAHFCLEDFDVETRVAIIGIIIEDDDSVEKLNSILHGYGKYIIGRMGLPYRARDINIISIAVDAPQDIISALSGKLGKLPGVTTKAVYSKVNSKKEEEVSDG